MEITSRESRFVWDLIRWRHFGCKTDEYDPRYHPPRGVCSNQTLRLLYNTRKISWVRIRSALYFLKHWTTRNASRSSFEDPTRYSNLEYAIARVHLCIIEAIDHPARSCKIVLESRCVSPLSAPQLGRFPETGTSKTRYLRAQSVSGPESRCLLFLLFWRTTTCFTAESEVQQFRSSGTASVMCISSHLHHINNSFLTVHWSSTFNIVIQAVLFDFQTVDLEVNFWKDD